MNQDLHRPPRPCAAIVDRLTFGGNMIETAPSPTGSPRPGCNRLEEPTREEWQLAKVGGFGARRGARTGRHPSMSELFRPGCDRSAVNRR